MAPGFDGHGPRPEPRVNLEAIRHRWLSQIRAAVREQAPLLALTAVIVLGGFVAEAVTGLVLLLSSAVLVTRQFGAALARANAA